MAWIDWATGVLAGIGAPADPTNLDTLWAWSGAESLPRDRMSINNPLDTTQELPRAVDPDFNEAGVEVYASVQDGITATVATLLNGRYPIIIDHLRNSIPRQFWGDACANLGTWGTGCGWLQTFYGAAPGSIPKETDLPIFLRDSASEAIYFVGPEGKRHLQSGEWGIYSAVGNTYGDTNATVLATIPDVPVLTPSGTVDLTPVLSAIAAVKADVDAIKARTDKDLAQ